MLIEKFSKKRIKYIRKVAFIENNSTIIYNAYNINNRVFIRKFCFPDIKKLIKTLTTKIKPFKLFYWRMKKNICRNKIHKNEKKYPKSGFFFLNFFNLYFYNLKRKVKLIWINIGIVTVMNYHARVPEAVSQITFAHEGHSFGSENAPDDTLFSPGAQKSGNFIMYRRATTWTDSNNQSFSDLSRDKMDPILHDLVSSSKFCFKSNCLLLSNLSFCVYLWALFYFKRIMGRFV